MPNLQWGSFHFVISMCNGGWGGYTVGSCSMLSLPCASRLPIKLIATPGTERVFPDGWDVKLDTNHFRSISSLSIFIWAMSQRVPASRRCSALFLNSLIGKREAIWRPVWTAITLGDQLSRLHQAPAPGASVSTWSTEATTDFSPSLPFSR